MSQIKLISKCKNDLLSVYNQAIAAIRPDTLIRNTIRIDDDTLTIKRMSTNDGQDINVDLNGSNIHLIGGGKSVLGMARGLAQLAIESGKGHLFSHGCLSLPVGLKSCLEADAKTRNLFDTVGVECLFGSNNNLPDDGSVKASQSILQQVSVACNRDLIEERNPLFIVLISGGGSACLTSPKYIDLNLKLHLIKFLVQKGADIVELNKVRRYFSNIKGGQLAKHILSCHPDSRVLSLIMSDVVGDPIEFIASGPTYQDAGVLANHKNSMLDVLKKYDYPLDSILENLNAKQTEQQVIGASGTVMNCVIGNNRVALDAATEAAKSLGYRVECIGDDLQGFSHDIVKKLLLTGDTLQAISNETHGTMIVGGGEAVIKKLENETWGKGGRAQEMALDYMIARLRNTASKRRDQGVIDVFLAGGTDGQDGPTDVAACLASAAEYSSLGAEHTFSLDEATQAKKCHDSYNFWSKHKPDWLIKTGLTGTNVMDLYLYMVSTPSISSSL